VAPKRIMALTPTTLMTVGIVTQIHGQHIPLPLSDLLVAGGLAWAVAERYWTVRNSRDERDHDARILGLYDEAPK
jgi:hypothetical protein